MQRNPRNPNRKHPPKHPHLLTSHPKSTLQRDSDPKLQHKPPSRRASREESLLPSIFANIADRDLHENPISIVSEPSNFGSHFYAEACTEHYQSHLGVPNKLCPFCRQMFMGSINRHKKSCKQNPDRHGANRQMEVEPKLEPSDHKL